jgi:hypothetical protein
MKHLKSCAAAVLALLAADAAFAQTTIKITGSTAYRKATTAAIIKSLDNVFVAADKTDISGADRVVITGTLKSTLAPVVVQAAWAGSVGGVAVLDGNLTTIPGVSYGPTVTWITASKATQAAPTISGSYSFGAITALTPTELATAATFDSAATADVAMSDTYQASTDYNVTALSDTTVGVVTFAWTKGALPSGADAALTAAYARLTNITSAQAVSLLSNGDLPLSMLTGNALDQNYRVVLTGRNNDSGTRLTAFAECGFGISSPPVQYSVAADGALTAYAPTGGNSSSSNVKTVLSTAYPAATAKIAGKNYILVSYVGTGTITAQELTYNGAAYSAAAVQEGRYSFWGLQHILTRGDLTGAAEQFVTDVTAQMTDTDAVANGVLLSTMQVNRQADGGQINTNL